MTRLHRLDQSGNIVRNTRDMFAILILSILLLGCNKKENIESTGGYKNVECVEPNNTYTEGSGHYAGFEWARENGGLCNGNSTSFNEGCEEYYRQLNEYNECIAKNRNK